MEHTHCNKQNTNDHFTDDSVRLKFLTTLSTRVNKPANQDAYVYALSAVATNQIALEAYPAARKDLDTCERILDTFDRVEPSVHAAFYRTLSRYHQTQSDFTAYYRTTLLYLACVELDDLSLEYKQSIAYDLSLAALVSETLYNFGELLLHPILSTLQSTPHAWLRDLLFAFNRGDLNAYHSLLAANSTRLPPILRQHSTALHQKISLAALTQLVFSRPPSDRAMTFTTISEETKVALDEIEHLIMKALSLGLVRGVIDQVEGVARISWVQPKVLEKDGVEGLRGRLEEWSAGVERLGGWVEGVGVGVWSA